MAVSRRALLRTAAGMSSVALLGLTTNIGAAHAAGNPVLANDVRQEFLTAWTAYRRHAWGRDELRPLSGTGSDFFIPGTPFGMTIIESLDTLYLMELDGELTAGIDWCNGNLDFNRDASVHVFESIIRILGGLLSGYHATGDTGLLARARDFADRILPAFTKSPTGAPYKYVNLRTGAVSGNQTPLAEVGSNITELGWLTTLTGDPRYFNAGKRALKAVYDRRSGLDLVGSTINVETGAWTDTTAQLDPPVDSFFEYLWDGYQFFGDTEILGWYRTLTAAILRHQAETVNGRLWFRQVDMNTGATRGRYQSELTAFYAGLLAQGGNVSEGAAYHSSWAAVLDRHKLPPEAVDYTTLNALTTSYELRPEYVDAALFLWLATGDEIYRTRSQDMWQRQKAHCKVAGGYSVVSDMTTNPTTKGDYLPGYWFSENMKYYYLMWADAPRFDYANNYLTTEGNVLRGLKRVAPSGGTFRLVNRASGRLLDVSAASTQDGGAVIQWDGNGGQNQRWVVTTRNGYTTLTSAHSGKVLDVPGASTADGAALIQWSHNGGANQQWELRPSGELVSRHSGKVAGTTGTGNGAQVVQQTANGSTTQQWSLT